MTVTTASFRGAFPAFASTTLYPDPQVQFWLDLSLLMQDANRWSTWIDYGTQLFTAHNLVLEYQSNKAGAAGQKPGEIQGPVTSGSVDKVSYGRNPGPAMDPTAGHWNLSTYGLRYVKLLRMIGAGPVQVGVPAGGSAEDYYPSAWPGPFTGPY